MKAEPEPAPDESEVDGPEVEPAPEAAVADPASSGPPTWALFVAAGAAVLSIALLLVVSFWPGSWGGDSPADQVEQAEVAEDAGVSAVDAATAAVPAVLSYDYRTLDADFAEAESYLTEEFAEKRTALFEQEAESGMTLREQVVTDEVVVVARVSATGLTRVSEDGERATVVVFVDQDSQKGKDAPRSLRMWATLSMIADGDGWLLDDICTEDECG
jgi:Mce-associated membrane protein